MEGAVRSFLGEELPPLQGREQQHGPPRGRVNTPGCGPLLGLPSALPKRSERSTEEEEEAWGRMMRRESWMGGEEDEGRVRHVDEGGAVSFGGLQGEGELGPGLALAEDDFLLLLLLFLTVLLQLHALLVNLSLLLHNTQLLLSLQHTHTNTHTAQTMRSDKDRKQCPSSQVAHKLLAFSLSLAKIRHYRGCFSFWCAAV